MNVVEEIKNKKIIHWFRNDQRVSDHEIISIHHTLKSIRCFYLMDAKWSENHQLGFPLIGEKRKQFIQESIQELNSNNFTEFKTTLQEKLTNISADELKAYFEANDNTYAYIETRISYM